MQHIVLYLNQIAFLSNLWFMHEGSYLNEFFFSFIDCLKVDSKMHVPSQAFLGVIEIIGRTLAVG